VLKRALFIAALLTVTFALAPLLAQELTEEIFVPAGLDPFDPQLLLGGANASVPCTDGGFVTQPLEEGEGFTVAGEFLVPTREEPCRAFVVPLQVGVPYKAIRVEFDVFLDHWVSPIFNNVTSLRRTSPKRHERILYYAVILRGDRRRTILDLGAERQVKQDHPWQEETQYHMVMEANLPARKITMNVYQGEDWVFGTQGKMTAREIKSLGGERVVKVDFSLGGVAFNAYFPVYGWKFSNLKVTAE